MQKINQGTPGRWRCFIRGYYVRLLSVDGAVAWLCRLPSLLAYWRLERTLGSETQTVSFDIAVNGVKCVFLSEKLPGMTRMYSWLLMSRVSFGYNAWSLYIFTALMWPFAHVRWRRGGRCYLMGCGGSYNLLCEVHNLVKGFSIVKADSLLHGI